MTDSCNLSHPSIYLSSGPRGACCHCGGRAGCHVRLEGAVHGKGRGWDGTHPRGGVSFSSRYGDGLYVVFTSEGFHGLTSERPARRHIIFFLAIDPKKTGSNQTNQPTTD